MRWGRTWPSNYSIQAGLRGWYFFWISNLVVGVAMASECGVVLELKVQQCVWATDDVQQGRLLWLFLHRGIWELKWYGGTWIMQDPFGELCGDDVSGGSTNWDWQITWWFRWGYCWWIACWVDQTSVVVSQSNTYIYYVEYLLLVVALVVPAKTQAIEFAEEKSYMMDTSSDISLPTPRRRVLLRPWTNSHTVSDVAGQPCGAQRRWEYGCVGEY